VNEKPRILIVEDELMVSMLIEETLLEAGYFVVGPFANMTDAIRAARVERLDAAVLDVNVAGQMIYPVAEELSARAIPFGFATGYGKAVSAKPWNDRPVLPKPFSGSELENLVAGLISKDAAK
jgi:DNA-binding response OmpR family regulator